MASPAWTRRHLLGIEDLSADEIGILLDTAEPFCEVASRPIKKVPTLRGRTVVNAFFEASTRTRSSFEIAEKRMSADNVNLGTSGSAIEKGESLLDTALNLEAMAPDAIVVRHEHAGVPHMLAARMRHTSIINAGDGAHEHPTQALLDALTIRQKKGRIAGLNVTIVGDIAHSRVARSNVHLLNKLGARVTVAGPRTLMPQDIARMGVAVEFDLARALAGADVVMMLRIQRERQAGGSFPSVREYFRNFALTTARMQGAAPDAIILHPGPMNRGVEISSEVADGPYSVILDQVANGVAVRMAVLYLVSSVREG